MITSAEPKQTVVLIRYGAISEVARFRWPLENSPERRQRVVVKSHRGEMLGTVLEPVSVVNDPNADAQVAFEVVRLASVEDERLARQWEQQCRDEFPQWIERIAKWKLELQLIDFERTLDGQKQILYVLCDRGPDSTKLALQAAATGLGIIEVQPVDANGLVSLPSESGGGCGSGGGGCGSGGGGCSS